MFCPCLLLPTESMVTGLPFCINTFILLYMEERDIVVLLKANAVRQVAARPSSDGSSWLLLVNDEPVGSARNQVRPFKTLDAVAKVVAKLGIERFEVTTGDSHR
jgi:hypothetical protein